ncbi:hypothetical protein AMECASPLE_016417 [Ameca splendens]|uniref:Secreted protein n=1 Tax=Ameca splendens TaxID=208324 RepID=A0ABV0Y2N5_9TELE
MYNGHGIFRACAVSFFLLQLQWLHFFSLSFYMCVLGFVKTQNTSFYFIYFFSFIANQHFSQPLQPLNPAKADQSARNSPCFLGPEAKAAACLRLLFQRELQPTDSCSKGAFK